MWTPETRGRVAAIERRTSVTDGRLLMINLTAADISVSGGALAVLEAQRG